MNMKHSQSVWKEEPKGTLWADKEDKENDQKGEGEFPKMITADSSQYKTIAYVLAILCHILNTIIDMQLPQIYLQI